MRSRRRRRRRCRRSAVWCRAPRWELLSFFFSAGGRLLCQRCVHTGKAVRCFMPWASLKKCSQLPHSLSLFDLEKPPSTRCGCVCVCVCFFTLCVRAVCSACGLLSLFCVQVSFAVRLVCSGYGKPVTRREGEPDR